MLDVFKIWYCYQQNLFNMGVIVYVLVYICTTIHILYSPHSGVAIKMVITRRANSLHFVCVIIFHNISY